MTIGGVTGTTNLFASMQIGGTDQANESGRQARMTKVMQPVADLLGMSVTDLQSQLSSGKTMAQLAQDKGVSRTDLVNAVKQGIQANAPKNADGTTATPPAGAPSLDQIANDIVDGKRPAHHHHHHGGGGGAGAVSGASNPSTDALAQLAQSLSLSTNDLMSKLQGGQHISDIASQQGVSANGLFDQLVQGMVHDSRS